MTGLSRRTVTVVLGAFLVVALVMLGLWVVVRGDGTAPAPPVATGTATPSPSGTGLTPTPTPATMTVAVYFHAGDQLVPVQRTVPRTSMVATAALRQLLAGPTDAERGDGIWSFFSARTAGMLRSLHVTAGVGYADFGDLRAVIPNASSSAGSAALLGELDATLKQFSTVHRTLYALRGDVDAFYEWLQLSPPTLGAATAATGFAAGVLGMIQPTAGTARRATNGTVTVPVSSRAAAGSRPELTTMVSLRRSGPQWTVTGSTLGVIEAKAPVPGQRVSSPLQVRTLLMPYNPGVPEVRVVQVTGGRATVLGTGRLTGEAERPFTAEVSYRRPTAGTGWVLVVERATEVLGPVRTGEVLGGVAIPVTFVRVAPPEVLDVTADASVRVVDGWWVLPAGAGRAYFAAAVARADKVDFYLVPTGTNTWPQRTLLPRADAYAGHPFTALLNYRDEPLSARIVLVATGPGGQIQYDARPVQHG